jgi:uncharacterized membrane protein required for colicin V production
MTPETTVVHAVTFNWYDFVVLLALIFGVWSGIRAGFLGEIIRAIGLVVMAIVALVYYERAGSWLHASSGLAAEPSNLISFVVLAAGVYLLFVGLRSLLHRKMKKASTPAFVENTGGGVLGTVRMLTIMICITIGLTLVRSPFWHQQIAQDSRFGSYVVGKFPAVESLTHSNYEEKLWFLDKLLRPEDPGIEDANKKQPN